MNQPRERDYLPEEWRTIRRSRMERKSLLDDGVCALLLSHGFRCAFDRSRMFDYNNWVLCDYIEEDKDQFVHLNYNEEDVVH